MAKSEVACVETIEREFEDMLAEPQFLKIKQLYDRKDALLYRINHLESTTKALQAELSNHSISFQTAVEAFFDFAVKTAFPDHKGHKVQVTVPNNDRFGDLQCNSALRLSKEFGSCDATANPSLIAKSIIDALPQNDLIEKVEVAGPGFINIRISKAFVMSELKKILTSGVQPPRLTAHYSVIIDMSSPNIAKEMHVGHLRSTIIGDGIARLLTFLGHKVLKLNHIGDWGTQFGMLIAHLQETFPDVRTVPPIGDLQAFYKLAKAKFDEDEDFRSRAYKAVVQLQCHDPTHIRMWQQICEISRREFQKVYDRLDIRDLVERGESFYQSRMHDMVRDLETLNMLQLDEGRKILWAPNCDVPLTIVKSDGGFTYDTSDLTALLHRIHEEKADWVIYVVDSGQGLHFNTLWSAAEAVGFYKPKVHRVEHVSFGVVLGEDKKKFKTRSGETVRLVDLLDEGLERSKKRLIEKGRDKELTEDEFKAAQEAIAYGCIKYADLSHNRINDYIFSFDKMLDDKGNTAVYLLYAYTRIRSIARNAGYTSEQLANFSDQQALSLDHPAEWKLAKTICRFPDILLRIQNDFLLHTLCDYLYDLSCTFTSFYDVCYCIERDRETGAILRVNTGRLMLCEATAKVMKCGFDILGLRTVERM
ncbi:Arginine--tRNA ligase, cytoplasmic [Clonorchis sinensis]|uniref:arginine--tRNA ligase n=2 Tax=Clonorchis sinensis TaxID=79923 RepID=A0A8T1MK56_CLOSI|nr:Arginine--tRNA ligase, cytoplasmic [Clonorchis sinensis]